MRCYTPEALPVLSGLAKGYAVCDHWFASAPTETMPNRAFACAGTSQGHMDDKTRTFTAPSIFGLLGQHGLTWGIFGYDAEPLTKSTFTDIASAAGGTIDEHGGCYDHVPPPSGAVPPDNATGEFGFDFTRFGVQVPAVIVSPLIAPGTVFRVASGTTPLDHTSMLKTAQQRWNLPALTARDAAAPSFADVLTLGTARTDDVLAGVTVPVSRAQNPAAALPSHLQEVQADLISRRFPAGQHDDADALAAQATNQAYAHYIGAHSTMSSG